MSDEKQRPYNIGDFIVFRETRPTRTGIVLAFEESDYTEGLMVYKVKASDTGSITEVEPELVLREVGKG